MSAPTTPPSAPPQHAEVIRAWAAGAQVEYLNGVFEWVPKTHHEWYAGYHYRVKPVSRKDLCDNG